MRERARKRGSEGTGSGRRQHLSGKDKDVQFLEGETIAGGEAAAVVVALDLVVARA